jgi:hypothetical protein
MATRPVANLVARHGSAGFMPPWSWALAAAAAAGLPVISSADAHANHAPGALDGASNLHTRPAADVLQRCSRWLEQHGANLDAVAIQPSTVRGACVQCMLYWCVPAHHGAWHVASDAERRRRRLRPVRWQGPAPAAEVSVARQPAGCSCLRCVPSLAPYPRTLEPAGRLWGGLHATHATRPQRI